MQDETKVSVDYELLIKMMKLADIAGEPEEFEITKVEETFNKMKFKNIQFGEIIDIGGTSTELFLANSKEDAETDPDMFIAFRGSREIKDWIMEFTKFGLVDLTFKILPKVEESKKIKNKIRRMFSFLTKYLSIIGNRLKRDKTVKIIPSIESSNEIQVMSSFLEKYNSIRGQLLNVVRNAKVKHIYITGHSLGGALATICAYDLMSNYKEFINHDVSISMINFGSPRVGNHVFKDKYNEFVESDEKYQSIRVVNQGDIVTMIPGNGFSHVNKEEIIGNLEPTQQDQIQNVGRSTSMLFKPLSLTRSLIYKAIILLRRKSKKPLPDYVYTTMKNIAIGRYSTKDHFRSSYRLSLLKKIDKKMTPIRPLLTAPPSKLPPHGNRCVQEIFTHETITLGTKQKYTQSKILLVIILLWGILAPIAVLFLLGFGFSEVVDNIGYIVLVGIGLLVLGWRGGKLWIIIGEHIPNWLLFNAITNNQKKDRSRSYWFEIKQILNKIFLVLPFILTTWWFYGNGFLDQVPEIDFRTVIIVIVAIAFNLIYLGLYLWQFQSMFITRDWLAKKYFKYYETNDLKPENADRSVVIDVGHLEKTVYIEFESDDTYIDSIWKIVQATARTLFNFLALTFMILFLVSWFYNRFVGTFDPSNVIDDFVITIAIAGMTFLLALIVLAFYRPFILIFRGIGLKVEKPHNELDPSFLRPVEATFPYVIYIERFLGISGLYYGYNFFSELDFTQVPLNYNNPFVKTIDELIILDDLVNIAYFVIFLTFTLLIVGGILFPILWVYYNPTNGYSKLVNHYRMKLFTNNIPVKSTWFSELYPIDQNLIDSRINYLWAIEGDSIVREISKKENNLIETS